MRCAKNGNSRSAAKRCRIDFEPSVAENVAPQRPEPWHRIGCVPGSSEDREEGIQHDRQN
jgi:hypothetical protein